jgi:hypothetical protein
VLGVEAVLEGDEPLTAGLGIREPLDLLSAFGPMHHDDVLVGGVVVFRVEPD